MSAGCNMSQSNCIPCQVSIQKMAPNDLRQILERKKKNGILNRITAKENEFVKIDTDMTPEMNNNTSAPVTENGVSNNSVVNDGLNTNNQSDAEMILQAEEQLLDDIPDNASTISHMNEEALLADDENYTSLDDEFEVEAELDYQEDPVPDDLLSIGVAEFDDDDDEDEDDDESNFKRRSKDDASNKIVPVGSKRKLGELHENVFKRPCQLPQSSSSFNNGVNRKSPPNGGLLPRPETRPLNVLSISTPSGLDNKNVPQLNNGNISTVDAKRDPRRLHSHVSASSNVNAFEKQITPAPNNVCFSFWKNGSCNRNNCRFPHLRPSAPEFQQNQQNNVPRFMPPPPPHHFMATRFLPPPHVNPMTYQEFEGKNPKDLLALVKNNCNIERSWMILDYLKQKLDVMSLLKKDTAFMEAYRHRLEETLLKIVAMTSPTFEADIAARIFDIKKIFFEPKWEDLFYSAEIQLKAKNFLRGVEYVKELFGRFGYGGWRDLENLLTICIEKKGLILQIWGKFKTDALQCERFMETLLNTVEFSVLNTKIQPDDLRILHKSLNENQLNLSPDAKTIFLKLFTPSATLHELLSLLSNGVDCNNIPLVTLEAIICKLNTATTELAMFAINFFDRIPSVSFRRAADSLNDLLVKMIKKGAGYHQVSQRLYSVLKNAEVNLSQESALRMMDVFCCSEQFNNFLQLCNESQINYSEVIPDWLALNLQDALKNAACQNLDVKYQIILLLVASDIPPEDGEINKVVNMLIKKRRFNDIFGLVKSCFERCIILSQLQLRHVVFALEDWVNNAKASIYVYTKMREAYPRPENRCECFRGRRNHSIQRTMSNTIDYRTASSDGLDEVTEEDVNMESDFEATTPDPEEAEIPSSPKLNFRQLRLISAELNQYAEDCSKFKELYMQAVELNGANDDCILTGLFLGMSGVNEISRYFEAFVNRLKETQSIDEDVSLALGRLGIRLMMFLYKREQCTEAYKMLAVFHTNEIHYINCGEGYGTQIESKDDMSMCDIANLCCDVCLRINQLSSAYMVFKYCQFGVTKEHPQLGDVEQQERNECAGRLMEGLIQNQIPSSAWEIFQHVHDTMLPANKTKLINEICCSFLNMHKRSEALVVSSYMHKHNVQWHKKTVKAFINCQSSHSPVEAAKMFHKGVSLGVYARTYNEKTRYTIEIPTDLSVAEMSYVFDQHMKDILADDDCDYKGLANEMKQELDVTFPFQFVVTPQHDHHDMVAFQSNAERTENDIMTLLTEKLVPPLTVFERSKQRIVVQHESVLRWLSSEANINRIDTDYSQLEMQVLSPKVKKKRTISMPTYSSNPGDMMMTICPTPKPFDTNEDENSEGEPAPFILETSGPSKRRVLVKNFADTSDPGKVAFNIRKVICAQLKVMSTCGAVPKELKVFSRIAKDLFLSFTSHLKQKGCFVYNAKICEEAMEYVNEHGPKHR